MWVRSLGWEDPTWRRKMATHSSILAWKISWTEEPGGVQSTGSQKESDMTEHSTHTREDTLYHDCSVQLLSCVRLFATPWTAARQVSLSITNSWSLVKSVSI